MRVEAERLVEVWRGEFCESVHRGHVAIWHAKTGLIGAFGDVDRVVLPRSSAKMVQALPLIESGAAEAEGLTDRHLALACASHQGAPLHTDLVDSWLAHIGCGESDFCCGPQTPRDDADRDALILAGWVPDRRHNNCSGKHTGFLTLAKHLGADRAYVDATHPVQQKVRVAFEEVTQETSPGFGIDGCSAPNFASTLSGMARAMAEFAAASGASGTRGVAMVRLREAMMAYPELVAGEGRACTRLMRAAKGRAALKTGAEGFFVAILPDLEVGVALKIADGATRAAEAAVTHILCALGVLDPQDPVAQSYLHGPITNWDGLITGGYKIADPFCNWAA